jgi:organic radical activating enzyme
VTNRKRHVSISLVKIQDYIERLQSRGLKAVIVSGGGEPMLYPPLDRLIKYLYAKGLSVGLITNGTINRLSRKAWSMLLWVRISVNFNHGRLYKIVIPIDKLNKNCVLGFSYIYDGSGKISQRLKQISDLAGRLKVEYVRILPDCRPQNEKFATFLKTLNPLISELKDKRFFLQNKMPRPAIHSVCHQSYFRPFFGEDGYIYCCDSIVLHDYSMKFLEKYRVCKADKILDFMDGKIQPLFNPKTDCPGCVFVDNNKLIHNWISNNGYKLDIKINKNARIRHKEFV